MSTSLSAASARSRKTFSARSTSSSSIGSSSSNTSSTRPVWNERPPRQLEEPEALAALDDDVHRSVVERLDDRSDARTRPDLVHRAVAGGEHEPELAVRLEALADQLAVARLEDVERDPLGGDEDDRQREKAELGHTCRVRGGSQFGGRRR